ncbi:MAG: B12-binding domain-containing radical SAM protein [Defluviitaleaceae bacterium]|nr:B12-binding domain-containing radical SAM protein [Defluviitaleaceae bacterium]
MRKIILLAINAKYIHSALSVWLLSAGIKKYARIPHDVEIIEATIHHSNEEIAGLVTAHSPDIVGISTYIWNARKLPDILRLLKVHLPKAVFVLGGPEASHNVDYWLESGADFVVQGEGERKLPELLDALAEGKAPPPEPTPSEKPINPYNETYISNLKGKLAYLETSRGCPYRCAFCLSGESDLIFFPIETVKTHLLKLSKSGAKTIKLVDRTFNSNPARAYKLFEYVMALESDCCFHFEIAADLLDEGTCKLLSTAQPGRIQLEAGLQSYHEPTLKAVSRKTDLPKAEANIRNLLQGGNIHIHVDLIAGLPYETLNHFQDSFDRAYMLGAHNLQLGFLKLLHGSVLRNQAKMLGIQYKETPPYEIICSPWLSVEDISILKKTENALGHTYNKSRFLSTLEYVLSASGLRPFTLFRNLGESVQNHGMPLEIYAEQVYECFRKMPNVNAIELLERMICDWLAMVKGKNMPNFMKIADNRRKQIIQGVEKKLGRPIGREEVALLPSGEWVFVDIANRDSVTKLYKLYVVPVM